MSLQLLRKGLGLGLRPPTRLAVRPSRGVYHRPPEDPMSVMQVSFGFAVIMASVFVPIMWYYWDLKKHGLIKARSEV